MSIFRLVRTPALPLRIAAGALVLIVVVNLFFHGAQPYAVNAVRAPFDKVAHAVLHFGLAGLLWTALGFRRAVAVVCACAALAAADEISQLGHAGRSADVWDWAASVSGAALAMVSASAVKRVTHRRAPH